MPRTCRCEWRSHTYLAQLGCQDSQLLEALVTYNRATEYIMVLRFPPHLVEDFMEQVRLAWPAAHTHVHPSPLPATPS